MTHLRYLAMFALLVSKSFGYRERRLNALFVGTMLDPFHFTTNSARYDRATYRIALKSRPWSDDFAYVADTAERVLAQRTKAA